MQEIPDPTKPEPKDVEKPPVAMRRTRAPIALLLLFAVIAAAETPLFRHDRVNAFSAE